MYSSRACMSHWLPDTRCGGVSSPPHHHQGTQLLRGPSAQFLPWPQVGQGGVIGGHTGLCQMPLPSRFPFPASLEIKFISHIPIGPPCALLRRHTSIPETFAQDVLKGSTTRQRSFLSCRICPQQPHPPPSSQAREHPRNERAGAFFHARQVSLGQRFQRHTISQHDSRADFARSFRHL